MPRLEIALPQVSPKRLITKASRSAKVFSYARAGYMNFALPRLRRSTSLTADRIEQLHKGIDVLDRNGNAVHVVPDDTIAKLNASLVQMLELERSLLGFPGPGRRRDVGEDTTGTRKPMIDVTATMPRDPSPSDLVAGQDGQAGQATPSQDLSVLGVDSGPGVASNG